MYSNTFEIRQGKYRVLFTEIEVLLFEFDLMGINFGSNPDEYKQEVKAILTRLNQNSSVEELKEIIYEVFVSYFFKSCAPQKDDPIYDDLAEEMWVIWQRYVEKGISGPSIYDFII